MIDLHSHVLPDLDDGARDVAEALALVQSMAVDGISIVCGTPHVRDDFPTSPDGMERALAVLRRAVADAGIAIEVRGGGEVALERLASLDAETRARFGLGSNPGLLLLETPYVSWPADFPRQCAHLQQEGVVPVIAHPERNAYVQDRPELLGDCVRAGAVVQLTAASLDGRLGRGPANCARRLIELELAHCVASDAHGPGGREAGLSSAVAALGGGELATWLTFDVPAALLEGKELPTRPGKERSRRAIRPWRLPGRGRETRHRKGLG